MNKDKTKTKTKTKTKASTRAERPSIPVHLAVRMFFVGAIAVVGAAYAIWRHYSVPRTPMLEPVPSATEVPVEYEPER